MTPILIALQKNHVEIVNYLLSRKQINVNTRDDEGRSLLSLLMINDNVDTMDMVGGLLTTEKDDVNCQDANGRKPLYTLVENLTSRRSQGKNNLFGNSDIEELEFRFIKLLLENGA